MKPSEYPLMLDCIERGVSLGLQRSRKHTDTPSDELIKATIAEAVMAWRQHVPVRGYGMLRTTSQSRRATICLLCRYRRSASMTQLPQPQAQPAWIRVESLGCRLDTKQRRQNMLAARAMAAVGYS